MNEWSGKFFSALFYVFLFSLETNKIAIDFNCSLQSFMAPKVVAYRN